MRKNIIVLVESIMFAVFWVFGVEINKNGVVNFQDTLMYFKILGFAVIFFICITALYIFLEKLEEKQEENKIELDSNKKISLKKYIIIAVIFLICWTPVFLAVFPGYFCYDAYDQYHQVQGGRITTQHTILHTILLGGIIHSVYLLTGSYNLGIAIYTILQAILASVVFSYTIFFMEKYTVSKKIRIIGILYYCFFPVIHMFVLNSSKDTIYTLIMILYITYLIDIYNSKEIFFNNKKNFLRYIVVMFLLCSFRNNGIYVIIGITILSVLILKSKKFIYINIILILIYLYIWSIITQIPNCSAGSPKEMLSVPMQQLAYVYNNSNTITNKEKKKIESMFKENVLNRYVPELADPIKKYFIYEKFFTNFKFYIELGMKHKEEYINSFLLNTIGYWHPNQIIDGYIKANINEFEDRKSCYFMAGIEKPGIRRSFFPQLEALYLKISSQGIEEKIFLFSIGSNIWFIFIILGYAIYKKRKMIILPLMVILITWFMMLLGPIVLVRYILIVFFALPLSLSFLFNGYYFKEN